nr:immunoglobulin light chain junction region [Macaca mulatta]MOX83500.1 immunoglobulin light chain junction region [Macaca mulatta]
DYYCDSGDSSGTHLF